MFLVRCNSYSSLLPLSAIRSTLRVRSVLELAKCALAIGTNLPCCFVMKARRWPESQHVLRINKDLLVHKEN